MTWSTNSRRVPPKVEVAPCLKQINSVLSEFTLKARLLVRLLQAMRQGFGLERNARSSELFASVFLWDILCFLSFFT